MIFSMSQKIILKRPWFLNLQLNFKILVAKLMKFCQNLENFTKRKKSQNKAQKYILAMKLRNSKMAGKFEFPIQKNSFSRCKKTLIYWYIWLSLEISRVFTDHKNWLFCTYLHACSSSLKFLVMSRVLKLKTRFSLLIHDAELCCRWITDWRTFSIISCHFDNEFNFSSSSDIFSCQS